MTSYTAEDLLTAERHIALGEAHVAEQEEVLTRLRSEGADTATAEELLVQYQGLLKLHREDRDRIAEALGRA